MNEIYIDVGLNESRAAVLDEEGLAEIHIERQGRETIAGNIYLGLVENVLPGMQAAFIDIGLERNAFLYIKDAVKYGDLEKGGSQDEVSINRILKKGDELLVQVSKEPMGTKGARVTTHITLPGRYIVLMPDIDYIGISRRIEEETERSRLKSLLCKIKPENAGIIIRTEAEGKSEEDFIEDINFLTKLWNKIKVEGKGLRKPGLIHKDMDLVYKSIRDLFTRDTFRMIINDKSAFKKAVELVGIFSPSQAGCIEYYDGSANILDFYGIEEKIERALSRKVWLKSGGYIVIDHTEALTTIDVNTGKFTGSSNLKDTVLLTNMEAAREIARQLRLRDIGGIIIIDFIDMNMEEHRAMVLDAFKKILKQDRTKSNVFGITQLGLLEMTRKKAGKRLSSILQKPCPLCEGSGRILDEKSIVMKIEKEVLRIFRETDVSALLIEVNDAVEDYIKQNAQDSIKYLEESYGRRVIIKGLSSLGYSEYKVKLLSDEGKIKNAMNPFSIGDKIEISTVRSGYLNASDRYSAFDGIITGVSHGENNSYKVTIDVSK